LLSNHYIIKKNELHYDFWHIKTSILCVIFTKSNTCEESLAKLLFTQPLTHGAGHRKPQVFINLLF